jgi:hypothetical protein
MHGNFIPHVIGVFLLAASSGEPAHADSGAPLPDYLRDRGPGAPTSRLGTYAIAGEWLVEPYAEYTSNKDFEYDPADLGFPSAQESLHGKYHSTAGRVFAAYGLNERAVIELDAGFLDALLDRDPTDVSGGPAKISESGLGPVRARFTWQFLEENEHRPEFFGYGEAVVPHDADKALIGNPDWILNGGLGVIRGFNWGTMTARIGLEYDTSSSSRLDFHEYAIEYLRRISPGLNLYLGYVVFEGDEAYFATELHWSPKPNVTIRFGNKLGVVAQALSATSNSADYVPTLGVIVRFGGR